MVAVGDRLRIKFTLDGKSETYRASAWPSHIEWGSCQTRER